MEKQKLVEWALEVCESCVKLRQQRVRLVCITSWLSCPFKERITRVSPPPACLVTSGPEKCSRNDDNKFCPLLHSPLYLDGEIIMLAGVKYDTEKR